jgi:hypothetical protein
MDMTSNEMNLQQYLEILRAHARLIIQVFVVAVTITGIRGKIPFPITVEERLCGLEILILPRKWILLEV